MREKPLKKTVAARNDVFQQLLAIKENRKKRNEQDEILVEGIESVKQALTSPHVVLRKIIHVENGPLSDWGKDLLARKVFEEEILMKQDLYDELSDKNDPAELMISIRYKKKTLRDYAIGQKQTIVIFDRPSDLGNLGSMIRTANAFGVNLFITHGHCVDMFEPRVIRSSLGAIFHTPMVHEESFTNLSVWIREQKEESGLVVVGSDSTGISPVLDFSTDQPLALILGNEAKGMSRNLKDLADVMLRIPMKGEVNSLNVACAGSILLWELCRNRL